MLFNSFEFALFLPVVFGLYWFATANNLKLQNALIVAASYVFYGWWDWRFLFLIVLSTAVDFAIGVAISRESDDEKRRVLLWVSILVNLGLLGIFKYYNFFVDSFVAAFSFFGKNMRPATLGLVLPVGISFYTFQTMSYTIDVYRKQLEPTRDFVSFAAFVSFFPQLVAGPIERATHLLPQFYTKRTFHYAMGVDGMRQILWGLFKKIVIADRCAVHVDTIFDSGTQNSGSTLLFGALLFAFQIYGDFSGYSDIAIGTSSLFGFRLSRNFAFPYFSRDIAEFWRRWHISLSSWFRDYVYIPLGGSRGGTWSKIRNTITIFLLSGLWHGANWTFVAWGGLNALYFLPLLLRKRNRCNMVTVAQGRLFPTTREFAAISLTFLLTAFAWIFFRAEGLGHAISIFQELFSPSLFQIPDFAGRKSALATVILVLVFLAIEWTGREHAYAIAAIGREWRKPFRWAFYYGIVTSILCFSGGPQQFIYFQF